MGNRELTLSRAVTSLCLFFFLFLETQNPVSGPPSILDTTGPENDYPKQVALDPFIKKIEHSTQWKSNDPVLGRL